MALTLQLHLGLWRLITHNRRLTFTAGPSSVTVIKQQSALICSYVHSNQLRSEVREGGRGRDRKRGGARLSLLCIHTYGTHWNTLTYTQEQTHTRTQAVLLSPCPSLLCRPARVILMGMCPGSALSVILHNCTTVELALNTALSWH